MLRRRVLRRRRPRCARAGRRRAPSRLRAGLVGVVVRARVCAGAEPDGPVLGADGAGHGSSSRRGRRRRPDLTGGRRRGGRRLRVVRAAERVPAHAEREPERGDRDERGAASRRDRRRAGGAAGTAATSATGAAAGGVAASGSGGAGGADRHDSPPPRRAATAPPAPRRGCVRRSGRPRRGRRARAALPRPRRRGSARGSSACLLRSPGDRPILRAIPGLGRRRTSIPPGTLPQSATVPRCRFATGSRRSPSSLPIPRAGSCTATGAVCMTTSAGFAGATPGALDRVPAALPRVAPLPLLQPGRFTELFFLDEATAFAAGHRPCALCRREDYVRFGELWRDRHPGEAGPTRSTPGCTASGSSTAAARQRRHDAAWNGSPTARSC